MEDQQEQLKADIKETSRKCKKLNREIEDMKNDLYVNWENLAKKIDELSRYEKGLSIFKSLEEELF